MSTARCCDCLCCEWLKRRKLRGGPQPTRALCRKPAATVRAGQRHMDGCGLAAGRGDDNATNQLSRGLDGSSSQQTARLRGYGTRVAIRALSARRSRCSSIYGKRGGCAGVPAPVACDASGWGVHSPLGHPTHSAPTYPTRPMHAPRVCGYLGCGVRCGEPRKGLRKPWFSRLWVGPGEPPRRSEVGSRSRRRAGGLVPVTVLPATPLEALPTTLRGGSILAGHESSSGAVGRIAC